MFATAAIKRKQLIDLIRDEVPPFQERYWWLKAAWPFRMRDAPARQAFLLPTSGDGTFEKMPARHRECKLVGVTSCQNSFSV
jgi:hypothetical protein